jgi:hypothetical protein
MARFQVGDLAAGTVSRQSNFVSARLTGTENRPQKSGNLENAGLYPVPEQNPQTGS